MAIVLDTGIAYAYYDRNDTWHKQAKRLIQAEAGGLILPALVVPEVDFLIGQRLGAKARLTFLRSLAKGDYVVVDLPRERYARVVELHERFADLELGVVDAGVVAVAESLELTRIATTDRRHFVPMSRALGFEIVPARSASTAPPGTADGPWRRPRSNAEGTGRAGPRRFPRPRGA